MNIEGDDFDLEADLAAALDGTANATPKQQDELAEVAEQETPEEKQERLYKREGRRFVPKEDEAEKVAKADEQQTPEQKAAPKVWRPNWYKDEYGPWDTLPENFRNALRDQERAAAQGIEKHATTAKAWEPVAKLLEPYAAEINAQYGNTQEYLTQLHKADVFMRQDPVAALNWLAQTYLGAGWDIQALADWQAQQGYQPQKIDPVKQELEQLRRQVEQLSQLPAKQQQETAQQQIAAFSKDKPDFDAVRPYMAAIAKQNPGASLDELYQEALWANPQTRERLLKEQEDKRLADLQAKRRNGAQSPRGGYAGEQSPQRFAKSKTSLEDDIAAAYDAAHGGSV